jgi:hypothetical protein
MSVRHLAGVGLAVALGAASGPAYAAGPAGSIGTGYDFAYHPDFFTGWAAQSGQTWVDTTGRPTFCGVDWLCGLTAPVTGLIDWQSSPPTGCTIDPPGSNRLTCPGTTQTISGYDFSLHGGAYMRFTYTATASTVTISGNLFGVGNGNAAQLYLINSQGGSGAVNTNLVLTNNTFEGNATKFITFSCWAGASSTCGLDALVSWQTYGSIDIENNYIHNLPSNFINNSGAGTTCTFSNNFVENLYGSIWDGQAWFSVGHGETVQCNTSGMVANYVQQGNIFMQDHGIYQSGVAALSYINPGSVGTFNNYTDSGNVYVANTNLYVDTTNPYKSVGSLNSIGFASMVGTFTRSGNYYDATGADGGQVYGTFTGTPAAVVQANNVCLVVGGNNSNVNGSGNLSNKTC